MAASLMVVVLLVLFLFIPACIALFMSGRSLLLIFLGAVVCQAAVAVAFAGLSARGWGRHHSFSTLSGCTRLTV
ncbi:hypothetical protein HPO73_26010 [Klebsiella variicola]|uniref:hypothetical protein n=1 Tax=Klebsiella variicola TaxID=244366 RepID=UPI0016600C14|nr:hypothetical protein [Klebsiella variicola]MBD0763170.1 hypothetical protein [Klebsiella variicola]UZL40210.1 hypothetical protein JMW42_00150 [Klebsiella pneumoniae]HBS6451062.1 hypothetical protein [Klebsiella pneumoniae]HCB1233481.1 hypothetical protein [Klebsiella pneumoniae]